MENNKVKDYGLVSVIMPTYRQKELLYKAVESVLNQSYKKVELIVIDDNKEESFKIDNAEYFSKLNSDKVVYISNEQNLGSTGSRNKGIFKASGDYVTFLDDDDVYAPFKIEKQLAQMIEQNADVSVCNLILTNENGKITDCRKRKYLTKKEPLIVKHFKYHITGTDTMMFKRQFLQDIGGFGNQDLGDEFYLMLKALEKNPVFAHVDYNGVYAVVHSQTGLSSGENKIKTEDFLWNFIMAYDYPFKKIDVRYMGMRHKLVLAIAYKKNRKYFKCLSFLLKAFFTHPFGMLRILTGKDR